MTESIPVVAAVRGAISVPENTAAAIQAATARLLVALLEANGLSPQDLVSALFTATGDLDADFPAHAARRLGWRDVPLLGAREISVPGALPRVVRVLLTVSKPGLRPPLRPVYLDEAASLRPDLSAPAQAAPAGERWRVAIVGLGQIGGSIGLALASSGRWWRVGHDASPAAMAAARAAGAFDEGADTLEEACAGARLAVLAAPVDALPELIERAAAALPTGAAMLDTGSTRAGLTEALARAAARGIEALGGHPISGNEGHGFAAARTNLFRGAPFCLLPADHGVPEVVLDLVEELEALPLFVDPPTHDRALASTSHLPYLISCALRGAGADFAAMGLAGPGFRDMTRLAGSDPTVALAYCRANAAWIAAAWSALRHDMDLRIAALAEGGR